jgi:diguanylate cyclase (GGDEF)-like protein
MTLYRQLLLFTLFLFSVLLLGVWIEKLHSTRSFLVNQLASHAQDTATSLGLSLSPVLAAGDFSSADTMMNAVFDRGYYSRISLKDVYGKMISEKTLKVEFEGVPDWFVDLIPIKTPVAEALIMAGWNQAGKLYVESHPGYAYKTLWETAVRISGYFLSAFILVLCFGALGLNLLLKPLKRLEQQAEAICRKEYSIQQDLPKTRELRRVVISMNRMTAKVRDMFAEQAKIAERLRRNAYSDSLTGLGNRRYIHGQVEAHFEQATDSAFGALMLVHVLNLQEINKQNGFEVADNLLKRVADTIKKTTSIVSKVALGRLTGGDFAIFLPELNSTDVTEIIVMLNEELGRVSDEKLIEKKELANIGCVFYESKPTFSQLLAEADGALQAACQEGPNRWVLNTMATGVAAAKGQSWWKDTLERTLESRAVLLYDQPVVESKATDSILHREVLARISLHHDEIVSAGVFVPMAQRLGLISLLDQLVVSLLFDHVHNGTNLSRIAVNISPASLADEEFIQWILYKLKGIDEGFLTIIFELAEYGAVQHIEAVKSFSHQVRKLGHAIGLDHFGQSFSNFGYLKSLRPEYVKIDRGFTKELDSNGGGGDTEFFIDALCSVAHSLDIKVIAEGVETAEQADKLVELNIDALQGYLFGKPEKM